MSLMLAACAGAEEEPAESLPGPDWALGGDGGGKADEAGPRPVFVDVAADPGETLTEARTRALTRYGAALLAWLQPLVDETLTFRGETGARLDATYRLQVAGGSCFNEESRWGTDHDILSAADLERMIVQVQYAAEFLRRFHEDAAGRGNRFFDTVVLCPSEQVGGEILLDGRVLYVGVDFAWGNPVVRDAFAIRRGWAAGKHLGDSPLVRVWAVLDPVGAAGIQLRQAIASAAQVIAGRLGNGVSGDTARLRADLTDLARDHVLPEYVGRGAGTLRERALARLATLDDAGLRRMASLWQEFVLDPENVAGMQEAVLATHQATARKAYDIDLVQVGLVVVGNFHDIEVSVSAFLPRGRSFSRYVTIEPMKNSIRVRQIGLVAVYTVDNVQVSLNVAADLGLETAGLEYALDRLP